MDVSAELAGVKLGNPTVLASGFLGVSAASLQRVASSGAGAVTIKSIGLEERMGHPNPVVVEVTAGVINAVGLSTPKLDEALDELKKAVKEVRVPVIASIHGRTVDEFGRIAEAVAEAKPAFVEANISCPNVEDELGRPFGTDAEQAGRVTSTVKDAARKIPLTVKLTPNVSHLKSIASYVVDSGADCITAINTVGPGMKIDLESGKPVLANKRGGLSGPAIKPVAVRCIYDIREVVDVPIIGVGGIVYGADAVEFLMAGASAVGVGTGIMYRGVDIFSKVTDELREFMSSHGYNKIDDLVGLAHEK